MSTTKESINDFKKGKLKSTELMEVLRGDILILLKDGYSAMEIVSRLERIYDVTIDHNISEAWIEKNQDRLKEEGVKDENPREELPEEGEEYRVLIEETLARYETVTANSEEEAIEKVRAMYDAEEISLTSDDFDGNVEFTVEER